MPGSNVLRSSALIALLCLGLAGCGEQQRLTIYSGRSQNLVGPLLEQFSEESGVAIDVRPGDSAELALLIDEEGEASPADVFYSQSPGATDFLATNGRLDELPADVLEAVDEAYRGADGQWVGVTARQRVLVYNTDLVEPSELPTSIFDVPDPQFAGRVAVAPANGSFQDFVTALRQVEGDDAARQWLEAMGDGGAPTYANNDAIVEAVGRGEVEMGLVNHYYALRFLAEDPDLPVANHVFADGDLGALVIPSTVSVTAASDSPAATELVTFLLSEDAQRYFAEQTREYPLAGGVEPPADVPPLGAAPDVDLAQLGGGLQDTIDLISSSGLGD